ncbi:formylmethanofuran dehydrogenase subunit B [bacterium]|nr:formylmethanofuran dehydrogenase subunit B [bacterium]
MSDSSPIPANDITVTDVACTRCACVCDDLTLTVRQNRIIATERACHLAENWYLQQNTIDANSAMLDEQPCELSTAIDTAAAWLSQSKFPLIYGLSGSSTPGQRAAVALADLLGASIDTTASEGHAPSLLALQQSGESTGSLGEIRHRSDLVIFWGADPETTHPRHLERYSLFAKGEQIPDGRKDRTLVVIDHREFRNQTDPHADVVIKLKDHDDFRALWVLRLLVQGEQPTPEFTVGLPLDQLKELAERMRNCRSGVIFFGYGVARQPLGHRVVEALLRLVIDLNEHTRFHARRLRMLGDVAGADNVLCWQTGFPFAVNLSRGYPRYSPGEFSAAEMLARGEPDVALLVGSERVEHFSRAALDYLATIPTILLDSPLNTLENTGGWKPRLRINVATYGVHLPGTAYRMDDVPIPLRASLTTDLPCDADVLQEITARLT